MKPRSDMQQGTLAGVARRIEQISGDALALHPGPLYPLLLRAEAGVWYRFGEWGPSENNRRARVYRLTRAGRKQLQAELQLWQQTTEIIARFLAINAETRP